jgi:hypothetical protein
MATYLAQRVVTYFTQIEADSQKSAQDAADALAMEKDGIVDTKTWSVSDEELTVEEDDGTDF